MRVLSLAMTAFGPYAETEVVDFRQLDRHRLFLIHGPTGAGKTSVLDAICYALYGQTSGEERQGGQMRSHHAAPETPTQVVFDFALGEVGYRVARSPQQERPKRKGSGTLVQAPDATLWRLPGIAAGGPGIGRMTGDGAGLGVPLATGAAAVTAAVVRLLGFSADEFRQVVVLPQGQFRDLLVADSKQREQILQTLFRTSLYHRVELALKERAKLTEKAWHSLAEQERTLLAQEQMTDAATLAERVVQAAADIAAAKAARQQAADQAETARVAWEKGRVDAARLQARDRAVAALAEVRAGLPEQDLRKQALKRGQDARRVEPLARNRQQAEDETAQAQQRQDQAEKVRREAEAAAERARAVLAQEQGRQPDRDAAGAEVIELDRLQGASLALVAAAAMVEQTAKAAATAVAAADQARRERDRTEADLRRLEPALTEDRVLAAEREARRVLTEQAVRRHRLAIDLAELRRRCRQADGAVGSAARAVEAAATLTGQTQRTLELLEQAWIDGQAGLLAAGLHAGQACPVCGAVDHPDPAPQRQAAPERSTVVKARTDHDQATRAEADARSKLAETQLEFRRLAQAIADKEVDLAESTGQTVPVLEQAVRTAQAAVAAAEAAARRVEANQRVVQDLRVRLDQLGGALVTCDQAARDQAAQAALARGVLAEREAAVPEPLRRPDVLARRLAEARTRRDRLEAALVAARKAAEATSGQAQAAGATAAAAVEARTAALARRERASQEFAAALVEAGFSDAAAFESARRDDRALAALERTIAAFEDRLSATTAQAEAATREADGLIPPDLAALEAAARGARERLGGWETRVGRLLGDLDRWERLQATLTDLGRRKAEAEQRFQLEGDLAEIAAGKGRNQQGLSFQRYVLAALLDDVVGAANHRLQVMSRGRYVLSRTDQRGHLAKAAGLDLEVLDTYTGRSRPVKTLSGGEGFLAALSLALGVVSVVEAYAGGIAIDTLFIDEGFGSLDAEALEAALRALIDLQAGGRLIGVISHVGELKERIPAQLEIIAGRTGSRTAFRLPG